MTNPTPRASDLVLAPREPTEAMIRAGCSVLNTRAKYKAMVAAAPQPAALGGEPEGKLIKLAAELANRRPLRPLQDICDRQRSISTGKLIEDVEMCGDTLAAIAIDIRNCVDGLRAHLAPLMAEIERGKSLLKAYMNTEAEKGIELVKLRAQLAERDALLKRQPTFIRALEQFEADDGTFVRLSDVLDALSASAEPSAPVERDELQNDLAAAARVLRYSKCPQLAAAVDSARAALERKP